MSGSFAKLELWDPCLESLGHHLLASFPPYSLSLLPTLSSTHTMATIIELADVFIHFQY